MSRKAYHSTIFAPKNPEKYVGNSKIKTRSSWETKFCHFCDNNENVIKWNYEGVSIQYIDENGKPHRYYPDFLIEILDKSGIIKKILIEVKPLKETLPPKKPKKISKSYVESLQTYNKNLAKWEAAAAWCKQKGIKFRVVNEGDIFHQGGKRR
jgi:hypothetical protein